MLTAYQLAAQGNGVTLVSDTMIAYGDANYPLCYYTIADKTAKRAEFLYYRKGGLDTRITKEFRNFMVQYFGVEGSQKTT